MGRRSAWGKSSTFALGSQVLSSSEVVSPNGLLPVIAWGAESSYGAAFGLRQGFGLSYPEYAGALFGRTVHMDAARGGSFCAPGNSVLLFTLDVLEEVARKPTPAGTLDITPLLNEFLLATDTSLAPMPASPAAPSANKVR